MAENNWSVNPRTGQVNPSTIVDEVKTVALDSAANAYGFRLDYVPYEVLATPIDIVENVTGGAAWVEVDGAPSAGQYYVDYDQQGRFGTGFVEFNAADNGKSFLVTYRSIGRVVDFFGSRPLLQIDVLTSSGTYTIPDNARALKVTCVGGGGGGGSSTINLAAGGGGGAQASVQYYTILSSSPSSVTYTIGAGGAGGTATGNGADGGQTSFDDGSDLPQGVCEASPGLGGKGVASNSEGGDSGKLAVNCTYKIDGTQGGTGLRLANGVGGNGGVSGFGGGAGRGGIPGTTGTGQDATGYGGGGGGGGANSAAASLNGGAGAPGVIIVEVY